MNASMPKLPNLQIAQQLQCKVQQLQCSSCSAKCSLYNLVGWLNMLYPLSAAEQYSNCEGVWL